MENNSIRHEIVSSNPDMCFRPHDARGIHGFVDDGKAGFHNHVRHTPQTVAGCRGKGVISMKSKMTMLNRQRQLMGACGS